METKSSNLSDLPPNENKGFWGEADIRGNLTPQPVVTESGHYFIRISGHQAQCTHCAWGFQLEPGDKIKDGHLYDREDKLVI